MKIEPHKPDFYIGGAYIESRDLWLGDFEATREELIDYSENCADTIEVFVTVIGMATAQCEYEEWWERVRKKNR